MIRRHRIIFIIDDGFQSVIAVSNNSRTGMLLEFLIHRHRFDNRTVWCQITLQNSQRALLVDRIGQRSDHITVMVLRTINTGAKAVARYSGHRQVQLVAQRRHQRRQTTSIEKILHKIIGAGRPNVRNNRSGAANGIKIIKTQINAGAARHGNQMNNGVCRTARRHGNCDRVHRTFTGHDFVRGQILPDHVDSPPAARRRHAFVARIGSRNGGCAGQGQPPALGNRHHGGRGSHRHTGAIAAGNAALYAVPLVLGDGAGPAFIPVFPDIGPRTQPFASIVATQHRPGRHENERQPGTDRPHDERRCRLVTASHQHRTVNRVRAQGFLYFKRAHVAVQHRCGLEELFRKRMNRHFHRHAASLIYALFHKGRPVPQMVMAGRQIRPCIDDRDDRLAVPVLIAQAHLHGARPMPHRAQIVRCKPPGGPKIFGSFCHRITSRCIRSFVNYPDYGRSPSAESQPRLASLSPPAGLYSAPSGAANQRRKPIFTSCYIPAHCVHPHKAVGQHVARFCCLQIRSVIVTSPVFSTMRVIAGKPDLPVRRSGKPGGVRAWSRGYSLELDECCA